MWKRTKFVLIIVFIITTVSSCSSPEYRSEPKVSPSATNEIINSAMVSEIKSTTVPDDVADKAFENLKTALRDQMEKSHYFNDETYIEEVLFDCFDNNIIVSVRLPYDYTQDFKQRVLDATGKEPFSDDEDMFYVLARKLRLEDGKLIDMGISVVPIYTKNSDSEGEVFFPNMVDENKRAASLKYGYGDNAKYLDFDLNQPEIIYYKSLINNILYETAISGGFGKFNNEIIDILISMNENNLLPGRPTLYDIAFRDIIAQNFSYSSITIPIWHELGIVEGDNRDATLFAAMYFGTISIEQDGSLAASAMTVPNKVYISPEGNEFSAIEFSHLIQDGDNFEKSVNNTMLEYADDYFNFKHSKEYNDFITFCDNVMDSILTGSFDYENDTLNFGPQGR